MSETNVVGRVLTGPNEVILQLVAAGIVSFQIFTMVVYPIDPWILRAAHLSFSSVIIFLMVPMRRKSPMQRSSIPDIVLALASLVPLVYIVMNLQPLLLRYGISPTQWDIVVATLTIALLIEIVRRTTGNALPILMILFLAYGVFGHHLWGVFWHSTYSWARVSTYVISTEGIYTTPLGVSATFVTLFIGFGCFLQLTGIGDFFTNFSKAVAGWARGGSGKVSIVSSGFFGMLSGSSVANVAVTGSLTIPLMKNTGFRAHVAAATEAVASTGGQLVPPVMGTAAFVMSDMLGVPYSNICIAAIFPALLYYVAFFTIVDFEAAKTGLIGLPRNELPSLKKVLIADGYLLLPVVVMLYTLVGLQMSPIRAGLYSIISVIILSWFNKEKRMGPLGIFNALQTTGKTLITVASTCAGAGIIMGVISLTGIGGKLAMTIFSWSGGNVLMALILTMFISLILGMGLPTVAAYIICASVVAPALTMMGIPDLAAHMFIFYFACISAITPPVALASFAAAGIANSSPWLVGLMSFRIGFAAYVIPYMIVFMPSLLMQGGFVSITSTVFTSAIGVFCIAGGLQRWLYRYATLFEQIVLFSAGLVLIHKGPFTDTIGLSLFALVLASQLSVRFSVLKPIAVIFLRTPGYEKKLKTIQQDEA